ncbi:MAG: hypothetical protein ACRELB_07170 [Polyangiaceae bacterium]
MRRAPVGHVVAGAPAVLAALATLVALAGLAAACSKSSTRVAEPATDAGSVPDPFASVLAPASASAQPPALASASALSASASPSPSQAPSADAGPPGSSVRLLEPGRPPRRKVRYTWHPDQKELLVMDLRTSAATEIGGTSQGEIPLPPVHITVDIDPAGVTPGGDLAYAWRVRGASVTATPGSPPAMAEGMRAEVAAVDHLAGRAVVSARGLSQEKEVTVDPATVVDAGTTGQMVEQVRQTLRDVAVPWPAEEIGVGAKWQKISQLDTRGSHLTQTDTFTLAALEGGGGTADDVLAQTAPPQVLRSPGGPSGADARMESMLGSGSSKIRFDLGRLVPQSHFDGTTTMVVSGSAQRVTMVMRVGIDVEGKPR